MASIDSIKKKLNNVKNEELAYAQASNQDNKTYIEGVNARIDNILAELTNLEGSIEVSSPDDAERISVISFIEFLQLQSELSFQEFSITQTDGTELEYSVVMKRLDSLAADSLVSFSTTSSDIITAISVLVGKIQEHKVNVG